jgi:hypothetical protein
MIDDGTPSVSKSESKYECDPLEGYEEYIILHYGA